jgi:hypothetical protein
VNENFKKVLKVAKVVIDELLKCFDIYIEVLKNLKNSEALEKVLKQFIERENLLEVREIKRFTNSYSSPRHSEISRVFPIFISVFSKIVEIL